MLRSDLNVKLFRSTMSVDFGSKYWRVTVVFLTSGVVFNRPVMKTSGLTFTLPQASGYSSSNSFLRASGLLYHESILCLFAVAPASWMMPSASPSFSVLRIIRTSSMWLARRPLMGAVKLALAEPRCTRKRSTPTFL